MARYFFDVYEGERLTRDDDGRVVEGAQEACDLAIEALPGIARDVLRGGEQRDIVVQVRRTDQTVLLRAKLHLSIEWGN
jgi:hypothetical protein